MSITLQREANRCHWRAAQSTDLLLALAAAAHYREREAAPEFLAALFPEITRWPSLAVGPLCTTCEMPTLTAYGHRWLAAIPSAREALEKGQIPAHCPHQK